MPEDIGILDYFAGAGKEYPPLYEMMKYLLASQYREPGDLKEDILRASRGARQYVGGAARGESPVGTPPQPAVSPMSQSMDTPVDTTAQPGLAPSFVPVPNPRARGWAGGESDYVPEQAPIKEPWEFEHEKNMEKFKQMNPDLNWDAIAEQAGGNVPGGNFSAMESSVSYTPTAADRQLFDYVENDIPRQEAMRMLDSRSRAYDPAAAKMLLDRAGQKDDAAASMIYSKAQEMMGQAKLQEVEQKMKLMTDPGMRQDMVLNEIVPTLDPQIDRDALGKIALIKMARASGDEKAVEALLLELHTILQARGAAGGQEVVDLR